VRRLAAALECAGLPALENANADWQTQKKSGGKPPHSKDGCAVKELASKKSMTVPSGGRRGRARLVIPEVLMNTPARRGMNFGLCFLPLSSFMEGCGAIRLDSSETKADEA